MPDDNQQHSSRDGSGEQKPPEPPANWKPDSPNASYGNPGDGAPHGYNANQSGNINEPSQDYRWQLNAQFNTARKYVTAAQVCAIVSLFIGGMILSAVAVVLAYVGFRKYSELQQAGHIDERSFALVKRSCVIAGVMAAAALVLNVISFIAVYPLVMEYVQTGDMSVLFGGSGAGGAGGAGTGTANGAGSGSSTWG